MPKSIANKSLVGRAGLSRRQIGNGYLRPKIIPAIVAAKTFASGSGTWTPGVGGTALVFMIGQGGSGTATLSGGAGNGGGGGGACYAAIPLSGAETFIYNVTVNTAPNADGADTILQVAGRTLVAGGGKMNGAGGGASGGDINRAGGTGGASTTPGNAGDHGGPGGATSGHGGGGGGAGGFSDMGLGNLLGLAFFSNVFLTIWSNGGAGDTTGSNGGQNGNSGAQSGAGGGGGGSSGTSAGQGGPAALSIIIVSGNSG